MQSRALAVIALAIAVTFSGCSQPTGPAGNYGAVQGVVSDAKTGAPIAGAQVCIFVVECQNTAADGTYKISTVPSDPSGMTETITASAAGYVSQSQQVHISPGAPTLLNIALTHT